MLTFTFFHSISLSPHHPNHRLRVYRLLRKVTASDEYFAPVLSVDKLFPALGLASSEVADGLSAEVYMVTVSQDQRKES
jgi:hypothetical protein